MTQATWRWLFAVSFLINIGLIGAPLIAHWMGGSASERALFGMGHEAVPDYLKLDAAQRTQWRAMEEDFLRGLRDSGRAIEQHRERMVNEIMADQPDLARIESERSAIFALQQAQQRRVIEQLLKERAVLRPDQRANLARLLIRQGVAEHTD
jgi:Spy/CpxP family protein refolding chaperone